MNLQQEQTFQPKVSIVIPVYNGSNYLENAIRCALAQTYPNIEILVVNDGSADEGATERIALSFGEQIRYFSKPNGGVSSALNYGIANMTGEYFSWLSHDDGYTPDKIADGVELLRQLGEKRDRTIAYTSGHFVDKNGGFLKKFPDRLAVGKRYSGQEMVHYSLKNGTLNGCCMLIPKTAFDECGGLNEQLRYSQDTLMWYTLFFAGYGLISDGRDNVVYRLHAAQVSQNRKDLFAHDSLCIAKQLAPFMARYEGYLFLYAARMAKYQCTDVVAYLQEYAQKTKPFSRGKKMVLALRLFYGRFRGDLKRIYYRVVLRLERK